MPELLKSVYRRKNELVAADARQIPNEEISWFVAEHYRILEEGEKEYTAAIDRNKSK